MTDFSILSSLGWQPFFQQQLSLEEWETTQLARVVEQHRSIIDVSFGDSTRPIPIRPSMPPLTVGDWVLLDQHDQLIRRLDRFSAFSRKAPGSKIAEQWIAANIDTAFVLCSLNDDFNLNRIERYLCMVKDAGCDAVVVLSKADLCSDADSKKQQIQRLDPMLCVEAVDTRNPSQIVALHPWCQPGKTIAVLGSSGAGKSTLTNHLTGHNTQATGAIRENDAKGRHTTTRRSLVSTPMGALIMDTPGMRELQLAGSEEGITATFHDIESLAKRCRFGDCRHHNEPGCAVRNAIKHGELEERRFLNFEKLQREQAFNASTLAQRRHTERAFSRHQKRTLKESISHKRGGSQ